MLLGIVSFLDVISLLLGARSLLLGVRSLLSGVNSLLLCDSEWGSHRVRRPSDTKEVEK